MGKVETLLLLVRVKISKLNVANHCPKKFRRDNNDYQNGGEKGSYLTPGRAVNTPHTG